MKIYTSDNKEEIEKDGITGETPNLYRYGRFGKKPWDKIKYWAVTVLPKCWSEMTDEEMLAVRIALKDKVKEMMDKDELSPEKERS